jgi:hypothetical protein
MNIYKKRVTLLSFLSLVVIPIICQGNQVNNNSITRITIQSDSIISENYIGNGVQWDPYQQDYGKVKLRISRSDWEKLYARLDFMKPHFIRIMMNISSMEGNGTLIFSENFKNIKPILDYCQSRNINVIFGDWGGGIIHQEEINEKGIENSVNYLLYLIKKKGFNCIKYFNLINEPNGYWSATKSNYILWEKAISFFYQCLEGRKLTDDVKIIGPDIAIWDTKETWWIDSCSTHLSKEIGLYDIHTYPSKITVDSGKYSNIIRAYKKQVPKDKQIVIGEIGLKFVEDADSVYRKENISRAQSKKYASIDDSQLFVYDYRYGIDMADALMQSINAGYSGSIAWMLDDAMHANEAPDKLKIWGFWNILGEEFFGKDEENVRPWFYAWSLLCKNMPSGSNIYSTKVEGSREIKAVFSGLNGKYMLALLNTSNISQKVIINSVRFSVLNNATKWIYSQDNLSKVRGDHFILPEKKHIKLKLDINNSILLPANSLVVFTSF